MKRLLFFLLFLLSVNAADAQLFLEEDFAFSGNVSGTNGWIHQSGTNNPMQTTTPGLSFPNYAGSDIGNAVSVNGIAGEDLYKKFPAQRKLYYSFMIKVVAANTVKRTGFLTFLGKEQNSGVNGTLNGNYFARIALQTFGDGTWKIGTSNWAITNATHPTLYSNNTYQNNQTYAVIVSFNMDDNYKIRIWIKENSFPLNETDAGTPDIVFTEAPNTAALPTSVDAIGLRQDVTCPSVVMDGLRVFGNWDSFVLPLRLLSFKGWVDDAKHVHLEWMTAQSTQVKHFDVEKSVDGVHFKHHATIPCINQEAEHPYALTDYDVHQEHTYYRIKIMDMDGKFVYSNVVKLVTMPEPAVTIRTLGGKSVSVLYPGNLGARTIKVIDFNGTVRKTIPVASGSIATQLYLPELPVGNYILRMEHNRSAVSQKFFLQ